MRRLLVAINVLLVFVILGLVFYWHPQADQPPMAISVFAAGSSKTVTAPVKNPMAEGMDHSKMKH